LANTFIIGIQRKFVIDFIERPVINRIMEIFSKTCKKNLSI
jgi:hypothetical protein